MFARRSNFLVLIKTNLLGSVVKSSSKMPRWLCRGHSYFLVFTTVEQVYGLSCKFRIVSFQDLRMSKFMHIHKAVRCLWIIDTITYKLGSLPPTAAALCRLLNPFIKNLQCRCLVLINPCLKGHLTLLHSIPGKQV